MTMKASRKTRRLMNCRYVNQARWLELCSIRENVTPAQLMLFLYLEHQSPFFPYLIYMKCAFVTIILAEHHEHCTEKDT